jgi:hypothetical protein
MHISFKIIKLYFTFILLDMFRTPLCPSSGASYCCTCSLWSPFGVGYVVSSSLALLLVITEQGWRKQFCSTCFGHHCVHHQELLIAAHAVSGHCVVLCRFFPPALLFYYFPGLFWFLLLFLRYFCTVYCFHLFLYFCSSALFFSSTCFVVPDGCYFYVFFSTCFVVPDGCCCLVKFLIDVPIFIDFSCLFGIDKFQVSWFIQVLIAVLRCFCTVYCFHLFLY